MENKTTRCTICDTEFTDEETKGIDSCPKCKTKSLPMSIDDDVNIKINTHELRILGIWAENYAVSIDNKNLNNAYHQPLKNVVEKIVLRINKQLKELDKDIPLTLSQEMENLRAQYPKADLYRNGQIE